MSPGTLNHRLAALWGMVVERVDAMSGRDRIALLGIGVALLAALELLVVLPTRATRMSIATAADEQARSVEDAASQARNAQEQAQSQFQARLAGLERELAALGVGASGGQSLGFLLSHTLRGAAVRLISLRELGAETIVPEAPEGAVAPEPAATSPNTQGPALYRHRYEIRLSGEVQALTAAVRGLETDARPLRLERVRLASSDGAAVEATVVLSVIGTERSWLSI